MGVRDRRHRAGNCQYALAMGVFPGRLPWREVFEDGVIASAILNRMASRDHVEHPRQLLPAEGKA
jgi:hypothetical protein